MCDNNSETIIRPDLGVGNSSGTAHNSMHCH